jgi:hypothetical protein
VVADSLKSPGSVPVNVNGVPEKVSIVFRLFFTLIIFAALVWLTLVLMKVRLDGVRATCGTPFPESGSCCGLLLASSVITKAADLAPSAPGEKVTLTVHDLFTNRVPPQVVVLEKSPGLVPVIAIEEMVTVPPARLVKVTFLAALVVPVA